MSSFVPNSHSDPATTETVSNDGFFPDLSLEDFKKRMAVGEDTAVDRLIDLLTQAMIEINHSLTAWRIGLVDYVTLADVPTTMYGQVSEKTYLYQSAVYNRAKSLLIETRKGYDSTKSGRDKSDQIELPTDDYYRASTDAMSRLTDQPRSTIELI